LRLRAVELVDIPRDGKSVELYLVPLTCSIDIPAADELKNSTG
jgi:hypothetical protein